MAALGLRPNATLGELIQRLSDVIWYKCLVYNRHPRLLSKSEFSYS